jgi:hypothetical protein
MFREFGRQSQLITQQPINGSTTSGVPTWTEWVRNLSPAATAAAVVVAAIWALFRYRRGRIFRPRCCIDLTAAGLIHERRYLLQVDIRISNPGDTWVRLAGDDIARIEVMPLEHNESDRDIWKSSIQLREDIFTHNNIRDEHPWYLEPGEDLVRSAVFVMPDGWHCCKIRVLLGDKKQNKGEKPLSWMAERVVFRDVITHAETKEVECQQAQAQSHQEAAAATKG